MARGGGGSGRGVVVVVVVLVSCAGWLLTVGCLLAVCWLFVVASRL